MIQEWLDVVRSDNTVVCQERRSVVHQTGLWHRGVHLWLFTPTLHLIVQQRGPHKDTWPFALDCSVSEHLQIGETYPVAAQRGVREELGLPSCVLERILQFRMPYSPMDRMISELYIGMVKEEDIHPSAEEITHLRPYVCADLTALLTEEPQRLCPWFAALLQWAWGLPTPLEVLWAGPRPHLLAQFLG